MTTYQQAVADAVAQKNSADDALLTAATQKPVATRCIQEQITKPAWEEKPSWFRVAESEIALIAPETQRCMAHRTRGHICAMPVDHTPLASAPDGVAAIITQAVDGVFDKGVLDPQTIGPRA